MASTPTVTEDQGESFVARCMALKPGESEIRGTRFDGKKVKMDDVVSETERLTNIVQPATARAAKKSGYKYKVERGQFITSSKDVFALVIVTCLPKVRA
jgi:flagellar basal body rod protein FlgC